MLWTRSKAAELVVMGAERWGFLGQLVGAMEKGGGGDGNYAVWGGVEMGWLRWDGCVAGFCRGTGERGAGENEKPLLG